MATSERMRQFFTRERAEAGQPLPLFYPWGEPTGEWIQVRGADCAEYRRVKENFDRDVIEAVIDAKGDPAKAVMPKLSILERQAVALIVGWSFEDPCTPEAVANLLYEAPQIIDQVKRFAEDRRNFYKPASPNISDGSSGNVNSTESQPQDQDKA
jgi:hypothetical protein